MPVLPLQNALGNNCATQCNISKYFSIISVNSNTFLRHERIVDRHRYTKAKTFKHFKALIALEAS